MISPRKHSKIHSIRSLATQPAEPNSEVPKQVSDGGSHSYSCFPPDVLCWGLAFLVCFVVLHPSTSGCFLEEALAVCPGSDQTRALCFSPWPVSFPLLPPMPWPQGSLLYWPELSLGLEPSRARAEPTLQLNGCACVKRSGFSSGVTGVAPLGCQGQNLALARDRTVRSQGSCYRAATTAGSETQHRSRSEGGQGSFSLELVSG